MHMITDPEPPEVVKALAPILEAREPFIAYKGKLTGCPAPGQIDGWSTDLFDMEEQYVPALIGAHPRFIVWSYGEPIAWLAADDTMVAAPPWRNAAAFPADGDCTPVWVVNPGELSKTTDRHRHIVCRALGGEDHYRWAEGWA